MFPLPSGGERGGDRGRRIAAFIALVATLVLHASGAHAAVDLKASVDRSQVAVGEQFTLTVEMSGTQSAPAPDLGNVNAFQVQYLGPSTQVSIVNLQVSASINHRYALVARQAGQFALGPFSVEYEGKRYEAPAISIRVTAQVQAPGAAQAGGSGEVRLVLSEIKNEPYVGEQIPFTVTLYVGNVRVDQVQYPKIAGEGFVLDGWSEPKQADEVVDGHRYRVVRFQSRLTPLRSGALVVAPTMDMTVLSSRRRGGSRFGDPFFDQFLGDTFADRRPYQAQAAPITLNVQTLPAAGRPAGFSGAVGRFDFTLDARPTTLDAGDPITVRMEIRGNGNLSAVTAPSVPTDDRFRRYDPGPSQGTPQPGVRAFEQVVIPKEAAITELPAVQFSYFDPAAGAYRTITRGPIPLTVHAAAAQPEPHVIGPAAQEGERPAEELGRDIVYIKDVPGSFHVGRAALYRQPWFVLLQLIPVASFVALALYVRRRERLAADPRLVRFRLAGRAVRHALATLRRQSMNGAAFYDELAAAVGAYLGAKLDLPPGAVDEERVLERLGHNGAADDLKRDIRLLFELVERARYAASATAAAEREQALRLAQGIVTRLDRQRGFVGRVAASVLVLVALSLLPAVAADSALDPHTSFFEGNTAYKASRYADAARAYESLVAAGIEGPALYFNLGNAYFKENQIGRAVLHYERALRLAPGDPDIRANLLYARELADDPEEEEPLWWRAAFPLAGRATTGTLVIVVALLWWGLWLVLGLRLFLRRFDATLTRTAWALGIGLLVVGGSLGARIVDVDWSRAAVVTASGDTVVRFEPNASGTQHFTVREGTSLQITDERDAWFQVRRRDGRRGWVPAASITPI